MNSIFLSFFAASLSCGTNLFFRKNSINATQSPTGFLLFFYLIGFISALFVSPNSWHQPCHFFMLALGASSGLLNLLLMLLTASALKKGPSGMTFAFHNVSYVFPGILLFSIFGTAFGFNYSLKQVLGILLVLAGLFIGARGISGNNQYS